jgi:uncharacterized membrane protein YccC
VAGTRGGRISEWRDRVVASDPGLTRLRMALSAAVAMASALALEYGYAQATHAGPEGVIIAMLLGGVMAMMGSMALGGTAAWPKVRTAVFFPVAMGVGLVPGALVAGHTDVMLCIFVLVMFAAVYVRRFGPAFFFYGFMIWMGYFFAAFLGASFHSLPPLFGDVAVATAWILLLSLTVLRTHPGRTLRRVRRAFDSRARNVARACVDLVESAGDPVRERRAARRLHAHGLRLAEAALMIEAWSAEPGALPPGWSGTALRGRVVDAQMAVDAMAHAAADLARAGGANLAASRLLGHVARREYAAVEHAAAPLLAPAPDAGPQAGARFRLAAAALDYAALAVRDGSPPEGAGRGDYAPVTALALGALPGSFAVASNVDARGRSWNPLRRAKLTTRQAIQVAVAGALAIVLGRQLSETRYYWAVIAAFIAFAGTATRSETSIKAANRVAGTLVGLGAGIGLAELTAGHTFWVLAVIVVSMTCGFYLVNVSYACMIFFVTIMVAQLYSVLHEFTPGLLVLRLEETALGAALGTLVGLVVLPTSTRDTVRHARRAFLEALAATLRATATVLEGGSDSVEDPLALTRVLEDRMRQLALVARPLTRPLTRGLWGMDPKAARHRLTLYAAAARHARALTGAPERISDPVEAAAFAESCRALADTAAALAQQPPGPQHPAPTPDQAALVPAPRTGTTAQTGATALSDPLLAGPASPATDLYHLVAVLASLTGDEDQPLAAVSAGAAAL